MNKPYLSSADAHALKPASPFDTLRAVAFEVHDTLSQIEELACRLAGPITEAADGTAKTGEPVGVFAEVDEIAERLARRSSAAMRAIERIRSFLPQSR